MSRTLPRLTQRELESCPPSGDGFGSLSTPRGHLPLKELDVKARIEGLLTELSVTQVFVNNLEEPLEATYIFPLPDRSAVTGFSMKIGTRTIEGVLEERAKARREYQEAIDAGRRAAIAEEERPDVFTIRVGNILPGEEAAASLSLAGQLPLSDGVATFRFPLVVAPRYIPGVPLSGESVGDGVEVDTDAVPDASRISPPVFLAGYPNPVRLSLAVDVAVGIPAGDLRSSLHAVVIEESPGGATRIILNAGERLDRDFILRFKTSGESVRTSLVLAPDDPARSGGARDKENGGTFCLTVVPPAALPGQDRPRDLAFVFDRSGSMAGWKLVAARRAMARMVDTLVDGDRFTILAFDSDIESPPGLAGLVPATDRNRFKAVEFLSRLDARGGTEIARPLLEAAAALAGEDPTRDRILVLVTDGQVGNEDQVLEALRSRLGSSRIFALGIDRAVNLGFLNRLACAGGGSAEIVESEDRLDEVMDQIHRRIGTPILTDLQLAPEGFTIDADSVVPARLPALFSGAPLVILGRYSGESAGTLTLRGRTRAGDPWSEPVSAIPGTISATASIWARGRLRDLEDLHARREKNLELIEKQILDVSLRFKVLCRFTAYVAVDTSEIVNPGGKVVRILQPVESPAGWELGDACIARPAPRATRMLDSALGRLGAFPEGGSFSSYAPKQYFAGPGLKAQLIEILRLEDLRTLRDLKRLLKKLLKLAKAIEGVGITAARFERLLLELGRLLDRKERGTRSEDQLVAEAQKVVKEFLDELAGPSPGPVAPKGSAGGRREGFWK